MYQTLITGANRGIGLEFTQQYLADGWRVYACSREQQPEALLRLQQKYPQQLSLHALDVADVAQIQQLAQTLRDAAIDVLINNAGVYPHGEHSTGGQSDWLLAFQVNSMAPYYMAQAFRQQVGASQQKKIVTLSSKMGSLDDNTSGGSYGYRASKAAGNMVMKSLSIDLKPYGIACGILHPGWVLTDMGGPNALISVQQSVAGLRKVIQDLSLDNAGRFVAYDGKEIAW